MFIPFNHSLTRKLIVAFGSLFDNIKLTRLNEDGDISQVIRVPITYGPKDPQYIKGKAIRGRFAKENSLYEVMPIMSYEITSMSYAPNRKRPNMSTIKILSENDTGIFVPAEVPYDITFTLTTYTKNQTEGLMIVEQILPFFNPDIVMEMKDLVIDGSVVDVPISLAGVSFDDNFEDGDQRVVEYNLEFTIRTYFYGPTNSPQEKEIRKFMDKEDNSSENNFALDYNVSEPIIKSVIVDTKLLDISEN